MSLLQEKLKMNSERRFRDDLLSDLPDGVESLLLNARAKFSRSLFDNMEISPFPQFEDGKLVTKDSFDLYWHIEYDRPEHVLRQLNETHIVFRRPVALHFGSGPVFQVDEDVELHQVLQMLDLLDDRRIGRIFVADRESGLIIDSYCGYLPDNRPTTQTEVVYEITYYQTARQGGALDALTGASDL
jgi:hypothetical protein